MKLEKKFEFSTKDFVNCGGTSNLYLINNKFVGKIIKNDIYQGDAWGVNNLRRGGYALLLLNHEFEIATELHKSNISVPEPIGVFNVQCKENIFFYPAFIMEYWENGKGVFINNLKNPELKQRAKSLLDNEINSSMSLGFICEDAYYEENSLYSIQKDKICVLDFEYWNKKNKIN